MSIYITIRERETRFLINPKLKYTWNYTHLRGTCISRKWYTSIALAKADAILSIQRNNHE